MRRKKVKTFTCEKCVFWDEAELCCEHPQADTRLAGLGVGLDFENDTCESFRKRTQVGKDC